MQEMDRRVALLRLLLADITNRERQATEAAKQLRAQLKRIVDFTVQYNGGVANGLAALAELEEQLAQQEMTLRHLGMLRQRARSEMEALIITHSVADAQARLAELEARRATLLAVMPPAATEGQSDAANGELASIDAEITELRAQIEAASDAAARTLTAGKDVQEQSTTSPREHQT